MEQGKPTQRHEKAEGGETAEKSWGYQQSVRFASESYL